MKKQKETQGRFAVTPQTAKFIAMVRDECLVTRKKAETCWVTM
jgi:hypothetical protein